MPDTFLPLHRLSALSLALFDYSNLRVSHSNIPSPPHCLSLTHTRAEEERVTGTDDFHAAGFFPQWLFQTEPHTHTNTLPHPHTHSCPPHTPSQTPRRFQDFIFTPKYQERNLTTNDYVAGLLHLVACTVCKGKYNIYMWLCETCCLFQTTPMCCEDLEHGALT